MYLREDKKKELQELEEDGAERHVSCGNSSN